MCPYVEIGSFPYNYSSVQFSHSVASDSLWPRGLQHAKPSCPSPAPSVYSNSCPLSQWCHPAISSSITPFSSCLQSFSASWFFPVSHFFQSGGQSIETSASASVLPMNIQTWFSLELTSWISLQSKGLSRAFASTTIWKHQFFSTRPSSWSNSRLYMATGKTVALTITDLCHQSHVSAF